MLNREAGLAVDSLYEWVMLAAMAWAIAVGLTLVALYQIVRCITLAIVEQDVGYIIDGPTLKNMRGDNESI